MMGDTRVSEVIVSNRRSLFELMGRSFLDKSKHISEIRHDHGNSHQSQLVLPVRSLPALCRRDHRSHCGRIFRGCLLTTTALIAATTIIAATTAAITTTTAASGATAIPH